MRQLFRDGKKGTKENIVATMSSFFIIYDTNYDILCEQFANEVDKHFSVKPTSIPSPQTSLQQELQSSSSPPKSPSYDIILKVPQLRHV